jgi:predicted esterase
MEHDIITSLQIATNTKNIQLETNDYILNNGIVKKIFIKDRYFYIYHNNNINYYKELNLFLFCHGSRDIAMNCILNSTSLISTFGSDSNYIVVFGQCDGCIQEPYIHKLFKKIAFGEIYWGITGVQNKETDIDYIKKIINYVENCYKINKKIIMGHSNGGVFCLLMAIYLPNVFDIIVSHQGGMGFDPLFGLDFHLIEEKEEKYNNIKKPKLLFYTGSLDGHKEVCQLANDIFLAEKYDSEIIIIENLDHNYKKECEPIIKKWIENNLS